jgi:hypothetical protein
MAALSSPRTDLERGVERTWTSGRFPASAAWCMVSGKCWRSKTMVFTCPPTQAANYTPHRPPSQTPPPAPHRRHRPHPPAAPLDPLSFIVSFFLSPPPHASFLSLNLNNTSCRQSRFPGPNHSFATLIELARPLTDNFIDNFIIDNFNFKLKLMFRVLLDRVFGHAGTLSLRPGNFRLKFSSNNFILKFGQRPRELN